MQAPKRVSVISSLPILLINSSSLPSSLLLISPQLPQVLFFPDITILPKWQDKEDHKFLLSKNNQIFLTACQLIDSSNGKLLRDKKIFNLIFRRLKKLSSLAKSEDFKDSKNFQNLQNLEILENLENLKNLEELKDLTYLEDQII